MIENCIILALDKRRELWEDLEKQCLAKGWNTKCFIVGDGSDKSLKYDYIDPITNPPNSWQYANGISAERHWKAYLSHRAILKYAINHDLDHFLLLEDDALILESRFDKVCEQIKNTLMVRCFDLFYLGWWAFEHENHLHSGRNLEIEDFYKRTEAAKIQNVGVCGGFHGVIINDSAYIKLLNLPPVAPMDHQCNQYNLYRKMVLPKIIHVKSTYSFCEDQFIKRDIL